MDVKIILTNYLQQKQVDEFHHILQCLQDCFLKQKLSIMYTEVKTA